MNKILPFCAGICMLIISSCTKAPLKEDAVNTPTNQIGAARNKNPNGSESSRLNESTLVPITLGTSGTYSGQYISSYSNGGVTFGLNLPHPTDDPTGIYDGYPNVGSIDFVNYMVTTVPCNTIVNGAYFTIFEPTFPTTGLTVPQNKCYC